MTSPIFFVSLLIFSIVQGDKFEFICPTAITKTIVECSLLHDFAETKHVQLLNSPLDPNSYPSYPPGILTKNGEKLVPDGLMVDYDFFNYPDMTSVYDATAQKLNPVLEENQFFGDIAVPVAKGVPFLFTIDLDFYYSTKSVTLEGQYSFTVKFPVYLVNEADPLTVIGIVEPTESVVAVTIAPAAKVPVSALKTGGGQLSTTTWTVLDGILASANFLEQKSTLLKRFSSKARVGLKYPCTEQQKAKIKSGIDSATSKLNTAITKSTSVFTTATTKWFGVDNFGGTLKKMLDTMLTSTDPSTSLGKIQFQCVPNPNEEFPVGSKKRICKQSKTAGKVAGTLAFTKMAFPYVFLCPLLHNPIYKDDRWSYTLIHEMFHRPKIGGSDFKEDIVDITYNPTVALELATKKKWFIFQSDESKKNAENYVLATRDVLK